MSLPPEMHDSNDPRDRDPLEHAFEAARRADEDLKGRMPEDVDALFERATARGLDVDERHAALLQRSLEVVPAPDELDARVREATRGLRPTRILRMTPWLAASLAAAAVLASILIPLLSTSGSPSTPRLVLHVVDEPIDATFDGRAALHAGPARGSRGSDGGKGR